MTVDELLNDLLEREGGFVNDPVDRGGATNHGITQATLSAWLGREATIEDVRNLTIEQAREVYLENYFEGPGISQLPDTVVPIIFDMAVNSGPSQGIRTLQQALVQAGYPIAVDGRIGPNTVAAAQQASAALGGGLVNSIVALREDFYRGIVARDPQQGRFLNGWLARARSFLVQAPDPDEGDVGSGSTATTVPDDPDSSTEGPSSSEADDDGPGEPPFGMSDGASEGDADEDPYGETDAPQDSDEGNDGGSEPGDGGGDPRDDWGEPDDGEGPDLGPLP